MRRVGAGVFFGTALLVTSPASAAVPHVVQPGETLWSIAAANNLTTRTVAAYNGIAEDAQVALGETIDVPTVDEGAATLATAGTETTTAPAAPAADTTTAAAPASGEIVPAPGMGHISSPWGELHLDPAAAESWSRMAAAAREQFGVELYPGGTMSAYRTAEQQQVLYDQYLAGIGAPANPPGSSTHELGVAVDVATPEMRSVIDQIGAAYGWSGTIPSEWWHVSWGGY
ncbi:MAG TPA: D-alanyl-D-alanine carboxypeptidase family protein [Solirubrobacterales bacterium]